MERERINEIFYLLIDEESDTAERKPLYERLCQEGKNLIESMIDREKPPELIEEYTDALESAAAACAYYNLALLDEAKLPESIASSELKITLGNRVEKAQMIMRDKLRAAAAALKSSDFYFGSIRSW